MTDLSATYERLARRWTHEQLADHYHEAKRRGEELPECDQDHLIRRPIPILAAAVPACATLSVAIHAIHVLPKIREVGLVDDLLDNAENSSALALHRCHHALELDGRDHDYGAGEWLPAVYDIAAPLLESARGDLEPPSVVHHVQDAVRWLSSALIELDQGSPEASAAIVDALARLLVVFAFTQVPGR
jgi:hypothetical protein